MCFLTFHRGSDEQLGRSYSRAERGTETEADSFSTTEVLVFETRKQSFPNVLDKEEWEEAWEGEEKRERGCQ